VCSNTEKLFIDEVSENNRDALEAFDGFDDKELNNLICPSNSQRTLKTPMINAK
jgi:hypothetical protein